MDELTKLLTQIELVADDVIDTRQQIVNLDAKRHKTREAINQLKELKANSSRNPPKKNWICVGDMFIKLPFNEARNLFVDDQYHLDVGLEQLRSKLTDKVHQLRKLEGKPEISGFNLKPLNKSEIAALRTGFKL